MNGFQLPRYVFTLAQLFAASCMYLFYNPVLIMLSWLLLTIYLLVNSRKIRYLEKVIVHPLQQHPPVTIVVAARNEEKHLRQALSSMAAQDYPNYNIVVVNDRSEDGTADIITAMSQQYSCIQPLHIQHLPGGWLGKSYALFMASKASTTDWLLFTDADVIFETDTLSKAVSFCLQEKASHMAVLPRVQSRSALLNSVYALFEILFQLRYAPWQASDPQAQAYVGIGAFNLVHKKAYDYIGTHEAFAMHPNDDLKLGEHIKAAGFKQQVVFGGRQVHYEWYNSVKAFIEGLTKNAFSSVDYSYGKVLLHASGALLFFVLPVPLLLLSGNSGYQLCGVIILCLQMILLLCRRGSNAAWWHAFMIPFAGLVMGYIMLKSAWVTFRNKGVYWSNRFYALDELKNPG